MEAYRHSNSSLFYVILKQGSFLWDERLPETNSVVIGNNNSFCSINIKSSFDNVDTVLMVIPKIMSHLPIIQWHFGTESSQNFMRVLSSCQRRQILNHLATYSVAFHPKCYYQLSR
jgi:N-acetyl-beta-hexosaminidase